MSESYNATRRGLLATAAWGLVLPVALRVGRVWAAESATVEIANGKLLGQRQEGAVSFRGIPYAADTGGRNRFMAPQPVPNWAGVREALAYGDRSPQQMPPAGAAAATGPGPTYSENCCVLNVYAPDLDPNARRPVMFWIHGGGFAGGSGEVDGTNLAKFGDVVVVTVNHRLNVFGYANLTHLERDYADSGVVGQLDLIAALKWTKTNIHAFGGDPRNVTIFGESGGGAKIMTLGVMPKAQGLYRRSINMSGSGAVALRPPADTIPVVDELLKVLGIDRRDARKLQEVPADRLFAAQTTTLANLHADQFRPVIDGRNIPHATLSREGLAMQASLPSIMSVTASEATAFMPTSPANLEITFEQLQQRMMGQYGLDSARAAAVVEGYRKDDPSRTPWNVLVAAASEAVVRAPMRRAAEAVANAHGAVYFLDFNWMTDPVRGAPHASDITYAFGNQATGRNANPGPAAAAVAMNEMSAFLAFARTGSPANPRLPEWRRYDTARRPTLVMEEKARLVDDFRANDRRTSESLPEQDTFHAMAGPLFRGGA